MKHKFIEGLKHDFSLGLKEIAPKTCEMLAVVSGVFFGVNVLNIVAINAPVLDEKGHIYLATSVAVLVIYFIFRTVSSISFSISKDNDIDDVDWYFTIDTFFKTTFFTVIFIPLVLHLTLWETNPPAEQFLESGLHTYTIIFLVKVAVAGQIAGMFSELFSTGSGKFFIDLWKRHFAKVEINI